MYRAILPFFFSLILSAPAMAQVESKEKSCTDLHYEQAVEKMVKARKIRRGMIFGGMIAFTATGIGSAVTGGYAALAAFSAVSGKIAIGTLGLTAVVGLTPTKSQAHQIAVYTQRESSKLNRKIKREVPEISDAEIELALQEGYTSGEFCDEDRLLSLNEISEKVIQRHRPDRACTGEKFVPSLADVIES